jgi:hypothetical protein
VPTSLSWYMFHIVCFHRAYFDSSLQTL